ncbi:LysR family transcriptional regulator [Tateyamaria sp. ANG-S1]|uniref:LysR family transcriptional regulator n=1 Tax=Tateyamaria sp. ANG-S1 TaxID=1577905 RepID=UPI00057F82E3|nr:LysR family transcriptional regulator [Tateyamaria sp. ANG-S1]KIC49534.1 LysR family transcriptional regulator [Tateyamaria sp. ANG-S1]
MQNWAEIRTAFQVAELKTISAAAEVLGLHRATVVRHIDVLEQELGAKIFHRHSRGYEPTEAGQDLLNVARATQDQFNQLAARTRNTSSDLSGDFIVTSHEHVAELLMPALAQFGSENPNLHVQYVASAEVLKLEYGAAHMALRSGPKPSEPDNVVLPFTGLSFGLYAHPEYLDVHGHPSLPKDISRHRFIRWDTPSRTMPFSVWFDEYVPENNVVLSSRDLSVVEKAVSNALGIGLVAELPSSARYGLQTVFPTLAHWQMPLWLVTHVDLHRSRKIQAFLHTLKQMV